MQGSDDTERTALIHGAPTGDFDPSASFTRRLDSELHKINEFYTQTEEKFYHDLDQLIDDHQQYLEEVEAADLSDEEAAQAKIGSPNDNGATASSIPRRYTTADVFPNHKKTSLRSEASPLARPQNMSDDSDDEDTHIKRPTFSRQVSGITSPRAALHSPQLIPSVSQLALSSSLGTTTGSPGTFSGSYNVNTVSSIDGSRAASPVRLFRHSRTHSVDDSELQPRTSTRRNNSTSPSSTSPARKRRSMSVSAGSHSRSFSVFGFGPSDGATSWDFLDDTLVSLKIRTTNLFVSLSELKSYVQLNQTGFSKALKKFDKTLNTSLRQRYLDQVLTKSYCFGPGTESHLASRVSEVVAIFASLVTEGDEHAALTQLQAHLRERVVFDRNTIWRDQMEISRIAHATPVVKDVKLQGETDAEDKVVYYTIFGYQVPDWIFNASAIKILTIGMIFFILLSTKILESEPQNRCLAVVVAASLLWATEAMPLFVTSLLIPFLVICLRIPCDANGDPMTASDASRFIFSQMWSSVIMLLLGGFTLAAALSKYNIAKMLATAILSRAGTNPKVVLLTLMFISTFLSMWISNVAAPVLCFSIAQPLLRTLPTGSPFAKGIILGIALASNVGGMASPIASPQNIIALENMSPAPTWGQWFAIAIPVCILSNIFIWGILVLTFKPGKDVKVTAPIRVVNERFGFTQWFISIVTILTIILWCFSHQLEPYVGEMGVLALIPVVVFFGSKILTSDDFNNFLWTIIALAMGGVALGKAVSTSGLLATVAHGIEEHVIKGLGVLGVLFVFGFIILVVATFVSHTVAALIILPLISSIGSRMEDPHPRLLVMGAAFLCSAAMGLPTSGFPNVTAICMVDEFGRPYLTVGNFISRGVPASILAYLVIVTVGYLIMKTLGF